jgi:hypothetical protein
VVGRTREEIGSIYSVADREQLLEQVRLHGVAVPLTRRDVMYVGPNELSWPWMLRELALADPVGIKASAAVRAATDALDRRLMRPECR